MHKVTLIPGDWIGPEVCAAVQQVIAATGVHIDWDVQTVKDGVISDELIASCQSTGVVLKARVDAPRKVGSLPPTIELRNKLGIWCAVRPVQALPGVDAKHPSMQLVVVREASEDIYSGLEHEVTAGVYEAVKITTPAACERIARFAFDYVLANGRLFDVQVEDPKTGKKVAAKRKRLTIVHKSNIMKKSDGLLLNTARRIGQEEKYKDKVETWEVIVDALCMHLVRTPEKFDLLLTGNLFGDIVSDLCSGLAGGITASPSISYGGDKSSPIVLFENLHGKTPELVGTNQANPIPMLNVAIHMLRHLGEEKAADQIHKGIVKLLEKNIKTQDLGGSNSCSEFVSHLIAAL